MKTRGMGTFDAIDLFQILRDGVPRTRSELSAMTGLARSTISLRLDELQHLGLIASIRTPASAPGRPATSVALNPVARVVLAIDVGLMHTTVAVTDLVGAVLAQTQYRHSVAVGPSETLGVAVDAARALLAEAGRSDTDLIGVGVALPVPVLHDTGRPVNPTNLPAWDGFPVAEVMSSAFHVPVLVDNDANAMAVGEHALFWPSVDSLLFVKVSTGIGAGIISGGQLQRGASGTAGAIGHVRVNRAAGVPCICGNTGCLVAVAGAPEICDALREVGESLDDVDELVAAVRTGSIRAIDAVRQAGRDVGEVLTTCASLFNPSHIVVGGKLAEAGDHLLTGIREVVYSQSPPFATEGLTIAGTLAGDRAGVAGASLIAIEHVLSAEYADDHLLQGVAKERGPASTDAGPLSARGRVTP